MIIIVIKIKIKILPINNKMINYMSQIITIIK